MEKPVPMPQIEDANWGKLVYPLRLDDDSLTALRELTAALTRMSVERWEDRLAVTSLRERLNPQTGAREISADHGVTWGVPAP